MKLTELISVRGVQEGCSSGVLQSRSAAEPVNEYCKYVQVHGRGTLQCRHEHTVA